MTDKTHDMNATELTDDDLDTASAGMLVPAVQQGQAPRRFDQKRTDRPARSVAPGVNTFSD